MYRRHEAKRPLWPKARGNSPSTAVILRTYKCVGVGAMPDGRVSWKKLIQNGVIIRSAFPQRRLSEHELIVMVERIDNFDS
jgi:hypothetical protein